MTAAWKRRVDGPGVILLGVDASPTSLNAAAYAIGLARRQGAHLVGVYVRDRAPLVIGLSAVAGAGQDAVAGYQAQEEIVAELRAAFDAVPQDTVRHEFLVRVGDPYQELVRAADEVGAEAIVVGASTQFGHRIAGSLAARLIRSARWPVVVVP